MRLMGATVVAAVLLAGCLSDAGAQTTGTPSGGAIGAPQGIPGSAGNSSPGSAEAARADPEVVPLGQPAPLLRARAQAVDQLVRPRGQQRRRDPSNILETNHKFWRVMVHIAFCFASGNAGLF
jgi:hypothetical protein